MSMEMKNEKCKMEIAKFNDRSPLIEAEPAIDRRS